jgi:translation initiation factor 2 subunit 1
MLYRIQGYPEVNEIVLCQVTKIYPNSVFVKLLEYDEMGMIHISEVSPGRIRNLRDYVSEGRQIVCKVLRLDREKGHIDLSLRRVNSMQRREKIDEIKSELKAESLIKNLSKKLKKPFEALYKDISEKILKDYTYIHEFFKDIVEGEVNPEKYLPKKLAAEIQEAVLEKFKPKSITLQGEIQLKTYASDGVNKIQKTLQAVEKISKTLTLSYLGAGRFKWVIVDKDYKPAEKTLKKVQQILEKFKDKVSTINFEREKRD